MAKGSSGGSGGRVRVFYAEFDGDDKTIQEGLRAVGAALTRSMPAPQVMRTLPPPKQNAVQLPLPLGDVEDEQLEEVDSQVIDEAASRQSQRSKRKLPVLTIVKDLDLHPKGKKSFRDFYAEKKPKTQYDQIAVAIYYLQKVLEIGGITSNHIYSCFKDVNNNLPSGVTAVRVPNDLPQIVRNCASKKGWVDISDSSNLTITQPGENAVEHDLPAKEG